MSLERQLHIEQKYVKLGEDRGAQNLERALRRDVTGSPQLRKLIVSALGIVESAIDTMKSASVRSKYKSKLQKVPTDMLAVLTTIVILRYVCTKDKPHLNGLLIELGTVVFSEIIHEEAQTIAPAYTRKIDESIQTNNTTNTMHILRTYKAAMTNLNTDREAWKAREYVGVGRLLLEAFFETGLIQIHRESTRALYTVLPTETLTDILEEVKERVLPQVVLPPMVVPPIPHTTAYDGGYLTAGWARPTYTNRNLRNRDVRKVADTLKDAPEILNALNKAQATGYRINKDILTHLEFALSNGVTVGVPRMYPYPKPEPFVFPSKATEEDQEAFYSWKSLMRCWYTQERERVNSVSSFRIALDIAREFKDEDAIYFPSYPDWRYRLYFQGSINPQGSDITKALLEFSEPVPLGERGLFWLKVHVANCYGFDAVTFNKRAEWVDENMQHILSMLNGCVFDSEAFSNADSPWCFLAACIDLVAAINSGNPKEYKSRIAVCMDATNSGAQHFSAMLRERVGGQLTNLEWLGNDKKADLYMEVKNRVDGYLKAVAPDHEDYEVAQYWLKFNVFRNMLKRPVMTYFYSATAKSCSTYLLIAALESGAVGTSDKSLARLCDTLTKYVRKAIENAMKAAAEAMRYLQSLVSANKTKAIEFRTPVNGLVINSYPSIVCNRVHLYSLNIDMITVYDRDFDNLSISKMRSAIAPNFIHSMDAAHLTKVINTFKHSILPIHDSMGTHAAYVDELHQCIREEFVNLYRGHNYLQELKDNLSANGYSVDDVEVPELGTLNIENVLESPFFFC